MRAAARSRRSEAANVVSSKTPPPKPDDEISPELLAYMRQQQDDAKFRARLAGIAKRWATAALAVLLAVTSGWDALTKLIAHFKGP